MGLPAKPKGNLPALPDMFGSLAPLEIPEMDPNDGLVKNYFHKKKLQQITEVQRMRAEIAEYNEREVKANANRLMTALMFGRDYDVQVSEAEAKKAEAQARILRAEAEEQTLKMNHIEHQAKINTILLGNETCTLHNQGLELKNEEQRIKNDMLKIERKDIFSNLKLKLREQGVEDDWTYEVRNG